MRLFTILNGGGVFLDHNLGKVGNNLTLCSDRESRNASTQTSRLSLLFLTFLFLLMILLSINARAYESTFSVTIPKEIVLDGDKKTATYSVDVKGSIQSGETAIVSVTPSTSFSLSNIVANGYPTKEAISAQVSQNVTSWTYNDIMKGATTSGKITANDISAGDWSGSLNFNVKFDVNSMTINVTNGEATYDGNATSGGANVEVVSPSNGYTITYGTTNGTYDLDDIPTYTNPGTYEVYYKIEVSNYTTKTGSLTITINEGLNGYTWEEVSNICAKGEAKEYFNVGDEAIINIGALPNAYNTTQAQYATIVVGDMTDTSLTMLVTSYSTLTPTHIMNTTDTNVGGWEATSMRSWLNSEYYSSLSNTLQSVITTHITSYSKTYDTSEVSYCADKVWLLSEKEVFGSQKYENKAASNVETQLAYFVNGGGLIRYSNSEESSECWWWLRSPLHDRSDAFTDVHYAGYSGINSAICTDGVFPAFTIGQPSLNDYSWSEIQGICKLGLVNEYFNVGDTKIIDIGALSNASVGTKAQEATLTIGNILNNGTTMTMLITSYSIKSPKHYMNKSDTNVGGWASTSMRAWLNGEEEGDFYNALPSDLQSIITIHKTSYSDTYDAEEVSYCDDKVWLLSEKELFGSQTYGNPAASNVETQIEYFANGGKTSIYLGTVNGGYCWLRSSSYTACNTSFVCVDGNGKSDTSMRGNDTHGVFPAFDIG